MVRILFICSANICRSPMAEGFLRKAVTDRSGDTLVNSAGFLGSNNPPPPDACTVMRSYDIDVSQHRSLNISDIKPVEFDLILTMETEHIRRVVVFEQSLSLHKIYTLKEFVQRAQPYGPKKHNQNVDDWLKLINGHRKAIDLMAYDSGNDVADPYGKGIKAFESTAQELYELTSHVCNLLSI